jgi:hypothetical protein
MAISARAISAISTLGCVRRMRRVEERSHIDGNVQKHVSTIRQLPRNVRLRQGHALEAVEARRLRSAECLRIEESHDTS